MTKQPPHIMLLMTDQQKASATSICGDETLRLPCWEELAADGITFTQAYSPSPICTPSRTSMMTGTSPLVHQVYCHQNHAPENLPQLPELLQAAGYYTLGMGHYEEDRSLDRGWSDRCSMDGTPALHQALQTFYQQGSREVGWSSGMQPLSAEDAHAATLTDETLRRVDQRPKDQPLFLHVAYIEPHAPYFPPQGFGQVVDPDRLPLPDMHLYPDRPDWHRVALEDYRTAEAGEDDIRRLIASYYGLIAYADQELGRLCRGLAERDVFDDAWVIMCSDHGDYTGEKGFFTKSETPYKCLLHVPLVIRPPRGVLAEWRGRRLDTLVELTDLFSTILGVAGCPVPAYAQGHDLAAWLAAGAGEPLREAVFSAVGAYHGDLGTTMPWGLPKSGRHPGIVQGARTRTGAYIHDPDYGDEAYDLETDPDELHNLFQQGVDLPPQIEQLGEHLQTWKQQCLALREELGIVAGDRNFGDAPPKDLVG